MTSWMDGRSETQGLSTPPTTWAPVEMTELVVEMNKEFDGSWREETEDKPNQRQEEAWGVGGAEVYGGGGGAGPAGE